MASLRIDGDRLIIDLSGREQIGAFRRTFDVGIDSVQSVRRVDVARHEVHGLRAPGTGLPGIIKLGTYRKRGNKCFAATYRDEPGYVITVSGEDVDQVVVSSPVNPDVEALGVSSPR